ncbi:DUF6225 family protein [Streptomyces sp. NPDC001889]
MTDRVPFTVGALRRALADYPDDTPLRVAVPDADYPNDVADDGFVATSVGYDELAACTV